MPVEVRLSAAARDDLIDIIGYLEEHRPGSGHRFQAAFDRRFELIARFPGLAEAKPRLGPGVRRAVIYPYNVYYAAEEGVFVLRVLHGARRLTMNLRSDLRRLARSPHEDRSP
jgi:plasmid stabilization system protein ParE